MRLRCARSYGAAGAAPATLAACVAAVAVASSSAAAHHAVAAPCPPRGQVVIASHGKLRVYRPKLRPGSFDERPIVACIVGSAARMTLIAAPRPSPPHGPEGPHLSEGPDNLQMLVSAGDVVAYVVGHRAGVDTAESQLIVADVARRQIVRETEAGHSVDAGFLFSQSVTALVTTPQAAVAWIVQRSGAAARSPKLAVYAAPRRGRAVALDEGDAIDPRSLQISAGAVHWIDGGVARSAPLP